MKNLIDITRSLPIPAEHGRHYAQYFATQLGAELGIEWRWADDATIAFNAPNGLAKGAAGTLTINGSTVRLVVQLPFLLAAMGELIEAKIIQRLDAVEKMAQQQPTAT